MAYTTIDKPNDYFNTVLYTGNGSTQSITGVGFQPDFTWIKARSTTLSNLQVDSVRGSDKRLFSNLTNAENTDAVVSSFDSDGFSVAVTTSDQTNQNSATFAAWNWLAGGTASSNTDGSITSQVSANTTSGFSIVSYTGTGSAATVGHGLGDAPTLLIVKNRGGTFDWNIGQTSLGWGNRIFFTTSSLSAGDSWNSTAPTSSFFSIGTASATNTSGNSHIAYCFAEKKGFSKFGSYTGNGNADGPFVYTGFKPAWVLLKISSGTTGAWTLFDNKRDPFNEVDNRLFPSATNAESDGNDCDFLSNGFKHRTTGSGTNFNGYSYIYMAFAENPFVTSTGIPATAR